MNNKNNRLRIIWIVPNVLIYAYGLGLVLFTLINFNGLAELNVLWIHIVFSILNFLVAFYGTYKIRTWVKENKM